MKAPKDYDERPEELFKKKSCNCNVFLIALGMWIFFWSIFILGWWLIQ